MITVIDYGMGNLRSVSKAIEHLGGWVKITSAAEDISKAMLLAMETDGVREVISTLQVKPRG